MANPYGFVDVTAPETAHNAHAKGDALKAAGKFGAALSAYCEAAVAYRIRNMTDEVVIVLRHAAECQVTNGTPLEVDEAYATIRRS